MIFRIHIDFKNIPFFPFKCWLIYFLVYSLVFVFLRARHTCHPACDRLLNSNLGDALSFTPEKPTPLENDLAFELELLARTPGCAASEVSHHAPMPRCSMYA
jgi:hypothetical protein